MEGYITEDEVLGINLVDYDIYCLDQIIKQNTNDKEFIPSVKKLGTDLPLIYIDSFDCMHKVIILFTIDTYNNSILNQRI